MLILLSVIWALVSYLLAGKLSFSFTEKPGFQGGQEVMRLFWIYSIVLAVLPILALILFGMFRLSDYFKGSGNKR